MNGIQATTRLHLNKRLMTFGVPLQITVLVAIISMLIAVILWRAGGVPGSQEWIEGSRNNGGATFGMLGFIVYLGVQAVASTFPFALTLGATRKAFVGGTLAWAAITSAYLTLVYSVLLMLELATGHWFIGFYVFDVYVLGSGNLLQLIPTVFLGSLAAITLGALFGASFTRFGSRGPIFLGAGLAILLLAALGLALPAIIDAVSSTTVQLWWFAVAAVVLIGAAAGGTVQLLRTAIVR